MPQVEDLGFFISSTVSARFLELSFIEVQRRQ